MNRGHTLMVLANRGIKKWQMGKRVSEKEGNTMKSIIRSSIMLGAVALATGALAASFTPGNIVVYRIGGNASGGSGSTLTNRGNLVWLDEWTTDLTTRVQSILLR